MFFAQFAISIVITLRKQTYLCRNIFNHLVAILYYIVITLPTYLTVCQIMAFISISQNSDSTRMLFLIVLIIASNLVISGVIEYYNYKVEYIVIYLALVYIGVKAIQLLTSVIMHIKVSSKI
jgi:hypothetical protein